MEQKTFVIRGTEAARVEVKGTELYHREGGAVIFDGDVIVAVIPRGQALCVVEKESLAADGKRDST